MYDLKNFCNSRDQSQKFHNLIKILQKSAHSPTVERSKRCKVARCCRQSVVLSRYGPSGRVRGGGARKTQKVDRNRRRGVVVDEQLGLADGFPVAERDLSVHPADPEPIR